MLELLALCAAVGVGAWIALRWKAAREPPTLAPPDLRPHIVVTIEGKVTPPRQPARPPPPLTEPDTGTAYVRLEVLPQVERVNVSGQQFGDSVAVVGESFHQNRLRNLDNGRLGRDERVYFTAWLVPEPDNPHDKLAVLIVADGFGPIGHLSETDARRYRPVMRLLLKHNLIAACDASLAGGREDAPSIGVWLQALGPTRMLKAVKTHITVNGPQP